MEATGYLKSDILPKEKVRSDVSQFNLNCPYCYTKIRAMLHPTESPHTGDFIVCHGCGGISIIADRSRASSKVVWRLRKPRGEDWLKIASNLIIQKWVNEWDRAHPS